MRKKKNQEGEGNGGGEASWLVTFSDLCTLLLTFFVLLLSMSSLNQRAFRIAFNNFSASSGALYYNDHESVILPRDLAIKDLCKSLQSVYVLDIRDLDEVRKEEVSSDQKFNLLVSSGNAVWVKRSRATGKFSFIFGDKLLFEKGSATLNPRAFPILMKLGDFIRESNYSVFVEGHTDNIPIHTQSFASNEDLSLARAQAVLEFLLNRCDTDPRQMGMGGYGSSHPIASNETEAGREMNRRVEIIFKREK
ncbi:flagellar motor protein MotB [Desulforhabdus amnigena]|uniref:Membrane protein n=1 Tax=Desulforhabdus amnigena TaxID=40218 RepID=A0A9W6FS11_9BACT|nr:flagellar motor protein MotB [Desulforhabdus amnigena]NLJ27632.1 OmpA family protein [Deltaproteobacteria bacterium]GLI33559.1 membrane protein [Desulforhabdus amnigena]